MTQPVQPEPGLLTSRLKRRRVAQDSLLPRGDGAKRALYHCNYCQRDISASVRIKCAVCRDFDLCLGCFAAGAEVTPHKAHHAYRVVEEMSFPLNHPDWGADEELLLLEALDMYGLGNWGAVGEHVNRGAAECAAHYERIYLRSPAFPEPTPAPEMAGIDPAAWIKERQRTRQEPSKPQPQAAARMKADSSAVGADGKPAVAELAEAPQLPNGVAAGSTADEEVAGNPPAQGGADGPGVVKAEPKAEPATQPYGAADTAAAATDNGPVSSRSGDADVDAAADGADAAASQHAAVKQDDDSKPQAGSTVDERVPANTAPHGANTPAQAAAVLEKLESEDAGAAEVAPSAAEATLQDAALTTTSATEPAAAAGAAAGHEGRAEAAAPNAEGTTPGTPDARASKRRRVETEEDGGKAAGDGGPVGASPPRTPSPGTKTAGSAGAKAKAKEDGKGSVGRKQEGGRRQEGAAAAGGASPKPIHAELGGLRMGGGGGGRSSTGWTADGAPAGNGATPSERQGAQGGGMAKAKAGVLPDLTGFHAKRLEFEPEYDAEAEALLADLEFREADTAAEVAAKLTLIAIYNERLTERARRREFIQRHGLLDVKPQQAAERRWTATEKEVHARVRAFARYMEPGAHGALADGLVLEQRLRGRIHELKELRLAGVRTIADAEQHEAELRRGGQGVAAAATRPGTSDQLRPWAALPNVPPPPGAASPAFQPPGGPPAADSRSLAASLAAGRGRRGVQLDITNLPGLEALTAKERELAAGSRLLPSQVLNMTAGLLREAGRRGYVSKAEARPFFRLEGARTLRLLDVLANAGWLQTAPPPMPESPPGATNPADGSDAEAEPPAPAAVTPSARV